MRIVNNIPFEFPKIFKSSAYGITLAPNTEVRLGLTAGDGSGATISLLIYSLAHLDEAPFMILFPDRFPWDRIQPVAIERDMLCQGGNQHIIERFCKTNAQLLAQHVEARFEREPDSTTLNIRINIQGFTSEWEVELDDKEEIERFFTFELLEGDGPSAMSRVALLH